MGFGFSADIVAQGTERGNVKKNRERRHKNPVLYEMGENGIMYKDICFSK